MGRSRTCSRRREPDGRAIASVARAATRPAPMVVGLLRDATRSREELVAENILLRQQLIVAARPSRLPAGGMTIAALVP